MIINTKLIGKRIKEIRSAKKIPQIVLAEKCGICESYLSYIECGKKTPSLEVIIRIANYLDTSVDSLLEGNLHVASETYEKELEVIMSECSMFEKRVIYETINSLKESIRQNKSLIIEEVKSSIKIY